MPISSDLFLAILAMDSYNRGYSAGIKLDDASGTAIGNATISKTTLDIPGFQTQAQAAGFYAVAYNWNGQKVISYRGTDNPSIFENELGPSDILNGWIAGAGEPTSQTTLAIEFYEAVTQRSVFAGRVRVCRFRFRGCRHADAHAGRRRRLPRRTNESGLKNGGQVVPDRACNPCR